MPKGAQLTEIAFQLMVWKAGHRHGILALVAAGERQPDRLRGGLRVFMKQLIEVPHPKEQHRIASGLFGLLVLLHHGRNGHKIDRNEGW